MQEAIFEELGDGMDKAIGALEKSLSKVRTGRASLSLLEGIRIDYYGTPTPINQVASLSIPESRLIVISPWDSTVLGAIEKAIQKSDLGLMPSNDGKLIRLAIPALTEERRRELVKSVRKMAEECKVKQRNVRRDANEKLKTRKKDNQISEDELYGLQEEVQKLTDRSIARTDEILAAKEKEVMEI
ncbi:MAG: ribosome recycling factor [Deltaproteobacteria bacterium]|nr:ribosome recycling factor [Deltaproteobacteria bacterium]